MTHTRISLFAILLAGLLASCKSSTQPSNSQSYTIVPPSDTMPRGHTWDDWIAFWYNWTTAVPTAHSPLHDNAPADTLQMGYGHDGTYILGGVFGRMGDTSHAIQTIRKLTLPHGYGVFFPLSNRGYDNSGEGSLAVIQTDDDSMAVICSRGYYGDYTAFQSIPISAEIDGVPVANLTGYEHHSHKPFDVYIADPTLWGTLPDTTRPGHFSSAWFGYWLMIEQFSSGAHTIHFRRIYNGNTFDVTYQITAQ